MVALHIRGASTARCLALLLLVVIAQRIAAQAAELRSFGLEVACQSMQRTRGVQRTTCNMQHAPYADAAQLPLIRLEVACA